MKERKQLREVHPPWQNTALDHWSEDVDPAVMAGDQYVDERDPGYNRFENKKLLDEDFEGTMAPFMHPMHDVTYGND